MIAVIVGRLRQAVTRREPGTIPASQPKTKTAHQPKHRKGKQ